MEKPVVRRQYELNTKSVELNKKDTWRVVKNYYELDSFFNFQICCVKNRFARNYLAEHIFMHIFKIRFRLISLRSCPIIPSQLSAKKLS